MRKGILSLTFILILNFSIFCQDYDEFEKWKKEEQKSFQEFKDKRDKEFSDYLKDNWKKFNAFKKLEKDNVPKPIKKPVLNITDATASKKIIDNGVMVKKIKIPEAAKSYIIDVKKIEESKPNIPDETNKNNLNFDFYGVNISMKYDESLNYKISGEINGEKIGIFWETLSKANYEDLFKQIKYYKEELKINDWGFCEFINSISKAIHPNSDNDRTLLNWFLLSKSGYLTKVGYNKDKIYLLMPSKNLIYGVPYFVFNKTRYYTITFDNKQIDLMALYTYSKDYPETNKQLILQIDTKPVFVKDTVSKTLKFNYDNKDYSITINLFKSDIKYYEYYPQTDFEVYFDAQVSSEVNSKLLTQLAAIIEGKSETEALNILLRFVQTAFGYMTDNQQFGREKPFFVEETLFYDYSDCEDRSVLFAFLVRNLLKLDVIVLDYPGHISTAVKLNNDISNVDYVLYKGEKYVICDPTYINASIGMAIPEFKRINPVVIKIKSPSSI